MSPEIRPSPISVALPQSSVAASQSLELTGAYRGSRRTLSAVCAVAIAWSTAQFDLHTLDVNALGKLDLSTTSIPLFLAAAVTYLAVRCVSEYAMMPVPVRRWRLAQLDFKITAALHWFAIVLLGAASGGRSLSNVFVASGAMGLAFLGTTALMLAMAVVNAGIIKLLGRQQPDSASTELQAKEFVSMSIFFVVFASAIAGGLLNWMARDGIVDSKALQDPFNGALMVFAVAVAIGAWYPFAAVYFMPRLFAVERTIPEVVRTESVSE